MNVTPEQRLQLIGAALTGLCANPEMVHPPLYRKETDSFESGYPAGSIASMAVNYAEFAILQLKGGETNAQTETLAPAQG